MKEITVTGQRGGMKPAVVMPKLIRCPTDPHDASGRLHTIIGCGEWVEDIRDDEGFVDCLKCGMFWLPEEERSGL